MANVKISDLTAAGAALGTQEFEVNEGGVSKKVTGSQIATYVEGEVSSSPTFTGQVSIADGTAAAPSLTNTGDTNTGVYFPAADEVGIATGGAERVKVNASGNFVVNNSIELGNATDTTLSRAGAGILAVEGRHVPSPASQAQGDILFHNGTTWARLPAGTAGQVLVTNGAAANPSWSSAASGGSLIRAPRFLTSGTSYTTPAGCTKIFVEAVGGGSSGVGYGGGGTGGGSGGGAGGYAARFFTVTPSTAYSYTIGAGGTGGTAQNNGGNTTFTVGATTITASGGSGASGGTGTNGDININGVNGVPGTLSGTTFAFGGQGGNSYLGFGGGSVIAASGSSKSGRDGVYGGGGGGAADLSTTIGYNGGSGGGGVIRIWEYA